MRLLFLMLLALLPSTAHAQQIATVSGRVSDSQGAPLSGVSVFVPGTLAATFTDEGGLYRLDDAPIGEVAVHFSLAGYRTHVAPVSLTEGEAATLDVTLTRQPFWERALLFSTDPDADTRLAAFSIARTLQTEGLPARTTAEAAGLLPGLRRDERSDRLTFTGGARVARALDGVPLPAPMPLPWPGISQLTLYGEHTPAMLAGGSEALLDVTTHSGGEARQFRIEALASPLSPTGLTELRGAVGTPLLGGRARFFVAGSLARQDDAAPAALPIVQVKAEVLARLMAQPQDIAVVRTGNPADVRYLPLPAGLPDTISLADLRGRLDIPPGYELGSGAEAQLRHAAHGLTAADFEETRTRRNAGVESATLLVRTGVTLAALDLDVTYAHAADARDVWDLSQALFRSTAYGRTDTRQRYLRADAGRAFGPLALRFTIASYRDRATSYDPRFSDDIESTFQYGNLDDAANAAARAYRVYRAVGAQLVPLYANGILPGQSGVAGLFALPGASGAAYAHDETDAIFLRLEQTTSARGHTLTLGVEQHQRARRGITIPSPEMLIRHATTAGAPAETYRDLLPGQISSVYYGYDPLGLETSDDEDLHAFTRQTGCGLDAGTCRASRRIAPLEVTRTGLYGADRFALGPLRLDMGLRYDLFSHNRRALQDPYALLPIARARDIGVWPRGVDPDFAVYFSGANIVGYRSSDGQFFDRMGAQVAAREVASAGRVRLAPGAAPGILDEAAFHDAPTYGVLQPRAALNLAVASQASLWLSYNCTASLPDDDALNATLQDYTGLLEGARFLPNADLRPEVATTYAVGGQIKSGRMLLALSVAQRQLDHMAVHHRRANVFPNNYDTFVSEGFVRVRSLSAQVQVERTDGLALEASYTLSPTRGTLLNTSLQPFAWTVDGRAFVTSRTDHTLMGLLDYRTEAGEGPRIGGLAVFERLHVVLAAEAQNGARYSAIQTPYPINAPVRLTGLAGEINGKALPWTTLVHLQAERGVAVRGREVVLFAQVRNLLDARNVRRVYAATGKPDDDGYLDTAEGRSNFPPGAIERTYYQARVRDPSNYGLPREVRLGLQLAL